MPEGLGGTSMGGAGEFSQAEYEAAMDQLAEDGFRRVERSIRSFQSNITRTQSQIENDTLDEFQGISRANRVRRLQNEIRTYRRSISARVFVLRLGGYWHR
jgi:hypothetical protein